uniref:Ataxin-10 domain-containing protein n=1 Tax=Neobodo designis TaxID=312471 RepID=A0A7S1PMH7_NEODS|eukprot:CAMPEP_0174849880 /NCGR_PEP_ID=MMETSP1114-20130205/17899_1 /TAXON_ID=312471 /ORGANISM="Neobodo designis, Strain CCAP 1951/1" /LENGTH=296 /DNA_ID=CAMNT_0016084289 /DNA_START=57 /DNA_END=947 /DNA_ORIENTATION=+
MPSARRESGANLISNPDAARTIGGHVDELVVLAQTDADLNMACVKFQMEHAASKASFDGTGEREHLLATLCRMVDLATKISTVVLHRAIGAATPKSTSPVSPRPDEMPPPGSTAFAAAAAEAPGMAGPASSVDDLMAGGELCTERDATLMQHCCRVAALAFLVSEEMRPLLQQHALDSGLLAVVRGSLCIPRHVELRCFAEGFKTEHMNVLSNFTFGSRSVCDAVAADEPFVLAIMGATRIDEENPGLVEWAEFTLRNVCGMSPAAADVIKNQKPITKPAYMPGSPSAGAGQAVKA